MPWKIEVAGGVDRYSWESFLASLPGTPKWIVVDGDAAVRIGVRLRWGTGPGAPVVFSCEGHLQNKFRERALDQDGLTGFDVSRLWPEYDRNDPYAPRGPLWTRDDYRRFLDQVLTYPADRVLNITSWIRHHDRVIREQFDLRDAFPGMPRGTGALEGGLDKIRSWLGTRTRRFQNVRRMNVMFGLMRANLAGEADPAHYSRIIREELARTNGRPNFDWQQHLLAYPVKSRQLNPVGSLYRLSDDAQRTTEGQRNAYLVTAQASTMVRKITALNAYHFTIGARQFELTKAKAPMVKLTGLKLRDFPTFLDEWDPANPGDPHELSAGHGYNVGWICSDNPAHRWRSAPVARLGRLLGCPKCNRVRGFAAANAGSRDPAFMREALKAIRQRWGSFETPSATPVAPSAVAPGPSATAITPSPATPAAILPDPDGLPF
jgi:hypothetical protein